MRNSTINGTSPLSDVLGALTGTFEEVRGKGGEWSYTKTPFFVALYATLTQGPHVLPFTFGDNVLCYVVYNNAGVYESDIIPILIGQNTVEMEYEGIAQIIAFGRAANVRPSI